MKALSFGNIRVAVPVVFFFFAFAVCGRGDNSLSPFSNKGIRCVTNGVKGTCRGIRSCPSALKLIKRQIKPKKCWFEENGEPVVCCADPPAPASPADTMPAVKEMLRIEPPSPTAVSLHPRIWFNDQCKPIPATMTAKKTGQKAHDKCIEYQEKYVYPCQKGRVKRADRCNWGPETLIFDGEDANEGEFPHMALLGYGDPMPEWLSDGMLLSDRFILTAAHNIWCPRRGRVTKIKIGIQTRSEKAHLSQYDVSMTYKHPNYQSPYKHDDIALLETRTRMHLGRFAVPICLHSGDPVNDKRAVATGWGITNKLSRRSVSDKLQKVSLTKFSDEECRASLRRVRLLPGGYNFTTQVCYGDRKGHRDTCHGDSGGPVQIKHPQIKCMYQALAVISWGRRCGVPNEPGFNTRVAPYVPWIESIVWP